MKKQLIKYFFFFKQKNDEIAKIEIDKSAKNGPDIRQIGNKIKQYATILSTENIS